MIEDADSAKGQVLRADHLFHVTLKYTRTADVIKNTIKRLVNSLEYAITEMLEKKKVKQIPPIALMKADLLKKTFPKDKEVKEMVSFYLMVKKVDKGQFVIKDEYRKNVAIVVDDIRVDIPKLRQLLDKTKEWVKFSNDF
ncbi:hypothetical protein FJZ53_05540 [Candidatus Woesearchaeota archaeon]|nr:hypothetical protein [Candidatus Woesearchaeota archaeon]